MEKKPLKQSELGSVDTKPFFHAFSPKPNWFKGCPPALAAAFLLLGATAWGEVSDFTEPLLERQPFTDGWSEILAARVKAGEPLPDMPGPETGPADSAEPASLLRYWRVSWHRSGDRSPGPVAREKILQAIQAEPSAIHEVLEVLPQNEQAARLISGLFDAVPDTSGEDSEKRREIRAWIYLHSGLRRDEVFEDVRRVDWEDYRTSSDPDPSLHAIQAREPEEAVRLFKELATGDEPGLAVVGAKLLMESSAAETKESSRRQLITTAADDKLPEEIREIAVRALINDKWEGRETWLVSCLTSENPGDVSWYGSAIALDRDHWIPILVKLLNGENRHAHDHAVHLLATFIMAGPGVDALRPLLPWLKDPNWSGASETGRQYLIQAVGEVDLPESVAGLLEVVRAKGESVGNIASAARSLAHYKAKEAVPLLKESLARCDDSFYIFQIIRAIDELQGFSNEEIIGALEAYYAAYPDELQQNELRGVTELAIPVILKLGLFFAVMPEKRDDLLESLGRHLVVLDKDRPVMERQFRNLLTESSASACGDALVKFLADETVTERQLLAGLRYRKDSSWKGNGFRALSDRKGAVRGFAAVLSGREEEMAAVLKSDDREAVAAVLAAARLTGDALDFERVASLLASEITNTKVGEAALSYLNSRDEPEAGRLLKAHYPDNDVAWNPDAHLYGEFSTLEQRVRKKFKIKDNLQEVIALIRTVPGSGGLPQCWCFFIYPEDTYAVRDYGSGRIAIRKVPAAVLEQVRQYVSRYRVDDLPALELMVSDGVHYRYKHATAAGVKSVFMNNPPTSRKEVEDFLEHMPENKGIVIYARLVNLFEDAFDQLDLRPGFGDGIEIIIPRETAEIKTVWKQGDDLRVLVENSPGSRHWEGVNPAEGKLTGAVDEPAACAIIEDQADLHLKFEPFSEYHFRPPWRVRKGDATLHSGEFNDVKGLWWCRRGKEPELLARGTFVEELVSPDGKWCVAAKALGSGWAEPNIAVRINLETREEIPLDLKPADNFDVITFLPAHGKFLIMRISDGSFVHDGPAVGPEQAEYHLLDAATGALEPVNGEFRMISENQFRPLQEAGNPDIVWAAEPKYGGDRAKTVVGRYDSKAFKFTPVKEIMGVTFDSADMWVDENAGTIHAAAGGDLLKISLSAE